MFQSHSSADGADLLCLLLLSALSYHVTVSCFGTYLFFRNPMYGLTTSPPSCYLPIHKSILLINETIIRLFSVLPLLFSLYYHLRITFFFSLLYFIHSFLLFLYYFSFIFFLCLVTRYCYILCHNHVSNGSIALFSASFSVRVYAPYNITLQINILLMVFLNGRLFSHAILFFLIKCLFIHNPSDFNLCGGNKVAVTFLLF